MCRGSSGVEQWTENPRVGGSNPPLGICGSSSVEERLLAKEEVAGSNPVFRSSRPEWRNGRRGGLKIRWELNYPCRFESDLRHIAGWCSGSTAVFGAAGPGSNPGPAASNHMNNFEPWLLSGSIEG